MCDFFRDNQTTTQSDVKKKKTNSLKKIKSTNSITHSNNSGGRYFDLLDDASRLRATIPLTPLQNNSDASLSSVVSRTSSAAIPVHGAFLRDLSLKSAPCSEQMRSKIAQIAGKTQRFIKVTNDLRHKIELLEEIYDGVEYKKPEVVNKLIQCSISLDTPQRLLSKLISKLHPDNESCSGRSIHPAYSNESIDNESQSMVMDSSGMFKVPPVSYQSEPLSPSIPQSADINHSSSSSNHFLFDYQSSSADCDLSFQDESLFLEHEGNNYVRVDDTNYHLIKSVSQDRMITTETGLQLKVADGIKIPMLLTNCVQNENNYDDNDFDNDNDNDYNDDQQYASTINNNIDQYHQVNHLNQLYNEQVVESSHSFPLTQLTGRKNYKDNSYLTHFTYQTSNPAKPFSDYVGLPPRPAPHMPFTLSSQLYTPELSISLTDRDCELMLTIDCSKKGLPQQQSLYYQIYSYKDEDRYAKPTSEVWGLVGEIRAVPLPMFCTISIPSGVHKHYFSIRSVDEFNRFSDWSNVVQVEVESNQNSSNGR